jgi:predicted transcriptional regulator
MVPFPTGDESDVASILDVLQKRSSLLERLAESPHDQRDLRDELGVSRSTVYKALKELEAAGLVTQCRDGYALTEFGRLAWRRHDTYLSRLRRLDEARPLLSAISDTQRLPLSVFEHGRIILPDRHAPERPLNRMEALSERSDRIRVASSAGMPRYLSDIHERIEAGRQTATLVLEPAALHRLEENYDRFDEALAHENLQLRVLERELPFAIVLFEDSDLGLFAYEDGVLVGAVYTDDESAFQWGEAVFDRFFDASTPV